MGLTFGNIAGTKLLAVMSPRKYSLNSLIFFVEY